MSVPQNAEEFTFQGKEKADEYYSSFENIKIYDIKKKLDFGDISDTEETLDDELNHNCQDMINFFLNDQISKLNIADN